MCFNNKLSFSQNNSLFMNLSLKKKRDVPPKKIDKSLVYVLDTDDESDWLNIINNIIAHFFIYNYII